MNRERLLKVREAILAHKEKFDYCDTIRPFEESTAGDILTGCGTCGCVAGFTCAIFKPGMQVGIIDAAERVLKLTPKESLFLFYCHSFGWKGEPREVALSKATIDDAIERIDYLLNRTEAA